MPGVYLSYPFCAQKCTYCNFASGVLPRELEPVYREALRAEIAAHRWSWTPETVYLGGGTPSQMDPAALAGLIDAIPGRPWREATIEAAPGTVTPEVAAAWRAAGITRVSLGVQSFVPRELARTGRKHTAGIVERETATLLAAGIAEINIDLIAGLPAQTAETWNESLDWIERLAPAHVSVYMLEVDEDSRLGQEVLLNGQRYGAPEVPGDERIAAFYETAVARLESLGIARYEISNFARPGSESLHNLKYWRLEPYVGFGADAHSFDGGLRSQNVESVQDYVTRYREGRPPIEESTPARLEEERFFVGLRLTEGIHPEPAEWDRFAAPIRRFLDLGLLASDGAALRLTPRGVLLSNEVFQEFLAA
ncbi:MAG TPA: coproporphyrinogen III oxidase [Solibacterales bacterium]|nr:coproporphyrinogen III oxidase [Bryobacterales bacterium]